MKKLIYLLLFSILIFFITDVIIDKLTTQTTHFEQIITDQSDIFGIDVSHHQNNICWEDVNTHLFRGKKLKFFYIKATEGSTHIDTKYVKNFKAAKKTNILVGSYHYFSSGSSPYTQFINFQKIVNSKDQDLIPMIDCETNRHWSKEKYAKNLKIFIKLLEKKYDKKPIIYTFEKFYNDYLQDFKEYPFAIADYYDKPDLKHHIWQFTDKGKIEGIRTTVDVNLMSKKLLTELMLYE